MEGVENTNKLQWRMRNYTYLQEKFNLTITDKK